MHHLGIGIIITIEMDVQYQEDKNIGLISTYNLNEIIYPGESGGHVTHVYSVMQFLIPIEFSGRLRIDIHLVAHEYGVRSFGAMFNESGVSSVAITQSANFIIGMAASQRDLDENSFVSATCKAF